MGVGRGWLFGGVARGKRPLPIGRFYILQARYALFQALFSLNLQVYIIFGGLKGAALFFITENVFWGTTNTQFFFPFPPKFIRFGGCKGAPMKILCFDELN